MPDTDASGMPLSQQIVMAVCSYFEIDRQDLFRYNRKREIARCRQIAMYLLREDCKRHGLSYPQIAQILNRNNHTTILHGCSKIAEQLREDSELRTQLVAVRGYYLNHEEAAARTHAAATTP